MAGISFVDALLDPQSGNDAADRDGQRADDEALDAYSRAVTSVADRLAPSVASLRVSRRVRGGRRLDGAGSAVVITPDGFMLTSAHVVAQADGTGRASFVDGREHEFRVVGAGSAFRSRRSAARRRRPHRGRARRRRAPPRRPARGRNREPARLHRVRHGGCRVPARPLPDRRRGPDRRQRDPDRRSAQPRELGWRAIRRPWPGGRHQHRRRRRRARPGRAGQRRNEEDHRGADDRRAVPTRLSRHRRRTAPAPTPSRRQARPQEAQSRSSRSSKTARPRPRASGPRT